MNSVEKLARDDAMRDIREHYGPPPEEEMSEFLSKESWSKKNWLKYKAHNLVTVALRSGKLVPQPCVECGCPKTEAHHPDYRHPLQVVWLCQPHHAKWHAKNKTLPIVVPYRYPKYEKPPRYPYTGDPTWPDL